MAHSYAEARRQAAAGRARGRQPGPGGGRGAQGRHPLAGRAGDPRRRPRSTSPTFAARYDELVVGARDNTLQPDAYQGANITLTNPGGIGTVASVPRLMPGQGTIIATGAIGYPPGSPSADPARLSELGVAKVMTMTRTYDHRVIQGAESGAFLSAIDELLQGEDGFYDEVFDALGLEPRAADGPPRPRRSPPHEPGARRGHARPPAPVGRTPRCCRPCRPPPRWSRRTACTATWPRGSTRSAREPRRRPGARPGDRRTSRPS